MNWDQLATAIPGLDWTLLLVYLRVQAFILALPGLGERTIPVRVRAATAMSLSPMLAALATDVAMPEDTLALISQAFGELVIGLSAGMLLRL